MDNASAGNLIQGGISAHQSGCGRGLVITLDGGANGFNHVLDLGFRCSVTAVALQALLMAFNCGLVIGHASSKIMIIKMCWLRKP